jgi:transcriptional regulator with XRE-family HTH domain
MTTTPHAEVAAEVRAARARRQYTQADLARHIGIRQDAYSRKERGLVPFSLAEVIAIADDLGVPRSSLIPERDTSAPPRAVA